MKQDRFFHSVCRLAIPAAIQSMLQASFSVVDQIMIGQLGSAEVAGVGLAGKFSSIFTVVVSAVGAAAGIMISQYLGQRDGREVRRSFRVNLLLAAGIALLFTALCAGIPRQIMGLYTRDAGTLEAAAKYLAICAATFLPAAGTVMLSVLLRCMEKAHLPLLASILSAICNTALNFILIFGRFGIAPMGVTGAAIATAISQIAGFLLILLMYLHHRQILMDGSDASGPSRFRWGQYGAILLPILVCEFMWSLGENVYASIYGRLGTAACAAMTLLNPIQGLMIGALSGLAQAAGILVGKELGRGNDDGAYVSARKLIRYGFVSSLLLSLAVVLLRTGYVSLYRVEAPVKELTRQIMLAYAAIAPFKVANMILGGGVLRSGGKTDLVMRIDLIGTWIFGVPLGLLAAFVLRLPIPYVYFILSLEECVRFGISMFVFRRKGWMRRLKGPNDSFDR